MFCSFLKISKNEGSSAKKCYIGKILNLKTLNSTPLYILYREISQDCPIFKWHTIGKLKSPQFQGFCLFFNFFKHGHFADNLQVCRGAFSFDHPLSEVCLLRQPSAGTSSASILLRFNLFLESSLHVYK